MAHLKLQLFPNHGFSGLQQTWPDPWSGEELAPLADKGSSSWWSLLGFDGCLFCQHQGIGPFTGRITVYMYVCMYV